MNRKLEAAVKLIEADRDEEARTALVSLLKADPTNDEAWVYLATVWNQMSCG